MGRLVTSLLAGACAAAVLGSGASAAVVGVRPPATNEMSVFSMLSRPPPFVADSDERVFVNDVSSSADNQPRIPKDPNQDRHRSVFDFLASDRRFTRLVEVFQTAGSGFQDDLQNPQKRQTVFAPTNEAFRGLREFLEGPQNGHDGHKQGGAAKIGAKELAQLVRYHIVEDRDIQRHELADGTLLETAMSPNEKNDRKQLIRVTHIDGKILLNMYVQVEETDVRCANGIVHAISDVLIPPEDAFTSLTVLPAEFSIQALALQLTGLNERVQNARELTALIPTNDAWKRLGHIELMRLFHPESRDKLRKIVEAHYCDLVVTSEDIQRQGSQPESISGDAPERHQAFVQTWSGEKVLLETVQSQRYGRQQRNMMVDHVPTAIADLPLKNGIGHALNAVINAEVFDEDEPSKFDGISMLRGGRSGSPGHKNPHRGMPGHGGHNDGPHRRHPGPEQPPHGRPGHGGGRDDQPEHGHPEAFHHHGHHGHHGRHGDHGRHGHRDHHPHPHPSPPHHHPRGDSDRQQQWRNFFGQGLFGFGM